MDLTALETLNPEFKFFTQNMPDYVKQHYFIRQYQIGDIIHLKTETLNYLGILLSGKTRVINEFENGNVYMLETNNALDYIGEVTLLAKQNSTSVTIEAASACLVFCVPRKYAEQWIFSDVAILTKLAQQVAHKLYRRSLDIGMKLFYPAEFIFVDYLIKECAQNHISEIKTFKINKTRTFISEEIGMNIKTLNQVITNLKPKALFHLEKGKLVLTYQNFTNAIQYLESSKAL
ncbi:Crp/Fnr family transcriptional regulator [Agrilactobacillus yilanensis]|uniref:Crp/Fnr family transcriptional regulator n=1 Tax=Agrilactobacillus yilanensis TaxID=2485997 RepID=A0ABW4J4N6_9LACO|nr:Crp/Fnr family transcriptional regulator [Agrilactobacillus yilanensis]